MATKKWVSLTRLEQFLGKLKTTFAAKDHTHEIADVNNLQDTIETININVSAKSQVQIVTWEADD